MLTYRLKLPFCLKWYKKNLSAKRETQICSPGREDPLEKGMSTHSNILAWRIPRTEEPGMARVHGITKS